MTAGLQKESLQSVHLLLLVSQSTLLFPCSLSVQSMPREAVDSPAEQAGEVTTGQTRSVMTLS